MEKFNKILVSINSIDNECFCTDGEHLFLFPLENQELIDEFDYFFIGLEGGCRSKYGWSKMVSVFTLEEFI